MLTRMRYGDMSVNKRQVMMSRVIVTVNLYALMLLVL